VDIQTIDQNYNQLQQQSQQTVQLITSLAQKLQTAANNGDQNAREWLLDLKEITMGFQQEQNQVTLLLQSIHNFVANQSQQPQYQQPQYQQAPPQYQQPVYQEPMYQQGGGGFGRFMHSTFGQAITTGAGFAIGDDIINSIF
jgi:ABC-type transporter Mla subunit MlaD